MHAAGRDSELKGRDADAETHLADEHDEFPGPHGNEGDVPSGRVSPEMRGDVGDVGVVAFLTVHGYREGHRAPGGIGVLLPGREVQGLDHDDRGVAGSERRLVVQPTEGEGRHGRSASRYCRQIQNTSLQSMRQRW